ncbi:MAG: cell surface protein, partial [Dermatophilaceae bacterium]
QVVTGDWDGDGKDGIGTFLNGTWYLRDALSPGPANRVVRYGNAGDRPMASDWNGVRGDGIGTFLAGNWYLSEAPA